MAYGGGHVLLVLEVSEVKFHKPEVGLHSLMKLSGGLHVLRILLLIPLAILFCLRRTASAVLLALLLALDLIANLLTRVFDLADDAAVALDGLADFLIQTVLLLTLLHRCPALGAAVLALLARLALVLLPDWLDMRRNGCARCCTVPEKALSWSCCALLLIPLLCPGLPSGGVRAVAVALSALNIAIALLRRRSVRRERLA